MKRLALLFVICLIGHGIAQERAPSGEVIPVEPVASLAKAVDALLHTSFKPEEPGAAVLVSLQGEVVYRHGFGLADLETREPITTDTAFYLASVAKQITAMSIQILAERKQLSYSDSVCEYFPKAPPFAKAITIRHLLTHTSGLPDHFAVIRMQDDMGNQDVLRAFHQLEQPLFDAGDRFQYSNMGYVLLSEIAARVSGTPYQDFVREAILEPLNMNRTLVYDESKPVVASCAKGYRKSGASSYRLYDYNLLTTGAGGMYSTAEDLLRWDRALYTEQLVPVVTREMGFAPQMLNDGSISSYGFGWGVSEWRGQRMLAHSGGLRGFRTYIRRIPTQQFTVIVLSNSAHAKPSQIAERITEIYLPERDGISPWSEAVSKSVRFAQVKRKPRIISYAVEIIDALGIDGGDVVADIGCGSGWIAVEVAKVVGAEGKVYAVEIQETRVRSIQGKKIENLVAVHSEPDDVSLPENSLDVAFLHDVASHVNKDDREGFYASITRALKPTGTLVVFKHHGKGREFVEGMRQYGFVPENPAELQDLAESDLDARLLAGVHFRAERP